MKEGSDIIFNTKTSDKITKHLKYRYENHVNGSISREIKNKRLYSLLNSRNKINYNISNKIFIQLFDN